MSTGKHKISALWAEFLDRDLEMDFQTHMRSTIIRQLKVVLIVWMALLALFAVPDLAILGLGRPFYYLLTFRILSMMALVMLYFLVRTEAGIQTISYAVALVVIVYTTGFMLFFIYRSDSNDLVMAVIGLSVMSMLMYIPIRFKFAFVAALYSVSITLLTRYWLGIPGAVLIQMAVFMTLPVVVGAVSAIRLGIWQRKQFVLLRETEQINRELQQTLAEKKELSGLLPICAACKKIRKDDGYWEQIESYIGDHSEAEFSHGICPDCSEELYGHHDWYKKKYKKRLEKTEPKEGF